MRSLMPMFSHNGFFDNALDGFFDGFENMPVSFKMPKVDIEDLKDRYEVTADMPGFAKDQISVTYDDNVLTISAQKDSSAETKDKDKHYIRRERSTASFKRQFVVEDINKDGIKADLKDGILKITLPKMEPKEAKGPYKIQIG